MSLRRVTALAALAVLAAGTCAALAGAEADWESIVALDEGPQSKFASREQARQATLTHLQRQQLALEKFLAAHPRDPRTVDARLRLARLFMVRGDLASDQSVVDRAFQMLDDLERDPKLPPERAADVAFARLSLRMSQAQRDLAAKRDALLKSAEAFAVTHPGDRRIAPLFAEIAGVFDDQPATKLRLLETAAACATAPELQRQLADDLKRVRMLNRAVELSFKSIGGEKVDIASLAGRVAVVAFFADWSPPSVLALARVGELTRKFPSTQVKVIGISLDPDPAAARAVLAKLDASFPIYCDGKAWESPLVRSLGINTLPTVWILDRRGRLRFLNASESPEPPVRQLLRER